MASQGPIVGIDLGTTRSAIAFLNAFGRAEVVPTADGESSLPSVVLFPPNRGAPLVGRVAKERSTEHPDRVVEFVKREMGDPDWHFPVDGRELRPETISALILRTLAGQVRATLGERPRSAVITCPAYFGDLERQATADAGRMAGLEVLAVFNEPTAAALAYGLHHASGGEPVRTLVYDLGGGTFDVTVLELHGRRVKVLATAGEHRLGGKDWDDELLNYVAEEFEADHGKDPREDPVAQQDLRNRCEAAKLVLSRKDRAGIFCRAFGETSKIDVTRGLFEELTRPLLLQTRTYLDTVLVSSGLSWEEIDVVLPVGGSSHMPQVAALLHEASGRRPEQSVDPDLAVVHGATYYAALLHGSKGFDVNVQRARQPLGRIRPKEREEELPALPPAAPDSLEEAPVLLGLPGKVGGEPDEPPAFAVPTLPGETGGRGTATFDFSDIMALGEGLVEDPPVVDVNSHSLAVLVHKRDGSPKARVMIPANTALPAQERSSFYTINDGQTGVRVVILEGEEADPDGVQRIGECVISGLPARPKGQEVEICYAYEADGRIKVSAMDVGTGEVARTRIERATDLTESDIEAEMEWVRSLGGV